MSESATEVIRLQNILLDSNQSELERNAAAHKLGEIRTPEALDALVNALQVAEPGVRYAVAEELAEMGEPALDAVLRALQLNVGQAHIYDSVRHILKRMNLYPKKQQIVDTVIEALAGPAHDTSAPIAAAVARRKLREIV
jgi:HEAT repeat protein